MLPKVRGTIGDRGTIGVRARKQIRRIRVGAMQGRNSREKAFVTASRREIRECLAHHLKAHYDLAAPMPDHLAGLAEKLVQCEREEEGGEVPDLALIIPAPL